MRVEEKVLSERMGINLKGWRHKGRFNGAKLYYKVSERTIMYDEDALNSWIEEQDANFYEKQDDMGRLLQRWKKVS